MMVARGWTRAAPRVGAEQAPSSSGSCSATPSCDAAHRPHHRRRTCRPLRRRPASARPASACRVYEATSQAGGRCRSYHDPALDMTIDNGNHLVLSGNRAALVLSRHDRRARPADRTRRASFPFVDLATGERWTLRANDGRFAWWIFASAPRAGHAPARLSVAAAAAARRARTRRSATSIDCGGALYERLIGPFLLAALNTEPPEGSAALAARGDPRDAGGGRAELRPLIAREGLVHRIRRAGARIHRERMAAGRVRPAAARADVRRRPCRRARFRRRDGALAPGDAVILAVPPVVAAALCRGWSADRFRAIVNAHFKHRSAAAAADHRRGQRHGGMAVRLPGRLSVTISAADRLLNCPARNSPRKSGMTWRGSRHCGSRSRRGKSCGNGGPRSPPRRKKMPDGPAPRRVSPISALAGDWTATGLPATIEGAIRSGRARRTSSPAKLEN